MRKRVVMVHIYMPSIPPMAEAFARAWPEAEALHLLDETLLADIDEQGTMTPGIRRRVAILVEHAADSRADGIIFTGSTFGPAVDEARKRVEVPVLKPDEAMVEAALDAGSRIGLFCVSDRSIPVIRGHLEEEAKRRGTRVTIEARHVPGAKLAKTEGRDDEHDRLVAEAAAGLVDCDVLLVSQVSMATAAPLIPAVRGRRVLTSPGAAVAKMKALVGA